MVVKRCNGPTNRAVKKRQRHDTPQPLIVARNAGEGFFNGNLHFN
jgi:hypothetical protein